VGRTSIVDEYVGDDLGRFAIEFVRPAEVGEDDASFADAERATAVCARVGFASVPLDFGVLVHDVRRVPGGAEMRSRFWIGGDRVHARTGGALGEALARIAKRVRRPTLRHGHALLAHCAEEMAHLATFLPRLYAEIQ
jgi:hypothetical protein